LERAMLTGALPGLRGPLCPRLASACNHRPRCNGFIIKLVRIKFKCKNCTCFAFSFHLIQFVCYVPNAIAYTGSQIAFFHIFTSFLYIYKPIAP
ncbi:MAG: hypothetical protein J6K73_03880, partial [Clostridia bacterium]|nr:hypothetical protein [Clostridia bacterium]